MNIKSCAIYMRKEETRILGVGGRLLTYKEIINANNDSVYWDGLLVGVVTHGTAQMEVNYKPYELSVGNLFLLYPDRLHRFKVCSENFVAECMTVSKDYMHEMDSAAMVSRRAKYGVRLFANPIFPLSTEQMTKLLERMRSTEKAIENSRHLYYKEVVLCQINLFYLDLSDIFDRHLGNRKRKENGQNRHDALIDAFIVLLMQYFKEHHNVEFYAQRLHLSTHYLTLLVKKTTGKSVSALIYGLLYNEACQLLTHSRLSVGQIALRLNFSDQSAFRKFFKRKSGVSPLEFRATSV